MTIAFCLKICQFFNGLVFGYKEASFSFVLTYI
jgi:hypothetical protein